MNEFQKIFFKSLNERKNVQIEHLVNGTAENYSDYKKTTGIIYGLEMAQDTFQETWELFFRSEDEDNFIE